MNSQLFTALKLILLQGGSAVFSVLLKAYIEKVTTADQSEEHS